MRYIKLRNEKNQVGVGLILMALKMCRELRDIEFAKRIHADVVESGDVSNAFILNTLIDMYVKCGSLETALGLFENMKQRNVVAWTALIMGYAQNARPEQALELYERMQKEGCEPDRVTLLAVCKACASLAGKEQGKGKMTKFKCLSIAKLVYSRACQDGRQMDTVVSNSLIDMFSKCGSLKDARHHFEGMQQRTVVSWNCIILGYAQCGEGSRALELYDWMQEQGYEPNAVTFLAVLKACSAMAEREDAKMVKGKAIKQSSLEKGREIHLQAVESRQQMDLAVATSLVDMYAKCGSMTEARQVFDGLQAYNMVSWTAMVLGYAQNGEPATALRLFARMQHEECVPDAITFVAALKACASLGETEAGTVVGGKMVKAVALDSGRAIHSQAAAASLVDLLVANTLIDMYSKCGSLWDARHVFEAMRQRSVVSWNCLVMGCVNNGEPELSLEFYRRMKREQRLPPDAVTFAAVVKACASLAALETGQEIEAEICNAGLESELMVANSLIDFYGKCGSMRDAERIFGAMSRRDVASWSSLIAGHGAGGNAPRVFELFEQMQAEDRLQPDGIVFLAVLTCCACSGLVTRAKECFAAMPRRYGITPSIQHYNCVVDLLGRAGQLRDAVEIAGSMPYDPGALAWMAILDAARKWNDPEVARTVSMLDC